MTPSHVRHWTRSGKFCVSLSLISLLLRRLAQHLMGEGGRAPPPVQCARCHRPKGYPERCAPSLTGPCERMCTKIVKYRMRRAQPEGAHWMVCLTVVPARPPQPAGVHNGCGELCAVAALPRPDGPHAAPRERFGGHIEGGRGDACALPAGARRGPSLRRRAVARHRGALCRPWRLGVYGAEKNGHAAHLGRGVCLSVPVHGAPCLHAPTPSRRQRAVLTPSAASLALAFSGTSGSSRATRSLCGTSSSHRPSA